MRLSALSCYSPDALDVLDWDRSTAWKTVGGAETKGRLKDFTLNCNTATQRGTVDARCPLCSSFGGARIHSVKDAIIKVGSNQK